MAVSAATAVAMLVVVVATAVFTAFAMMVSATVATACQHLDGLIDLFLCGIAVLADGASEIEGLASQGVVGIDGDAIFLYLHHSGHELMVLAVCQCDDGIRIDVLMVEMTVDREHLALQLMNALGLVGTEGLCWLDGEIEGVAFRMLDHLLLKRVEGDAKTGDKLEGALRACFLLKRLLAVDNRIQLIFDRHELIGNFIHTLLYIYMFQVAKVIILIHKPVFFD